MTKLPCSGDWLVDYADGELPAAESAQAELHLAACLNCSREVVALRSSRELLNVYFAKADILSPIAGVSKHTNPQTRWNAAAMALASIAATALLVSIVFLFERERNEAARTVSAPTELPLTSPAVEQHEEDDFLALISRETQIARLRTASEILANEPGMNDRHLALEKYLAEAYGVTKVQPFEM